MVYTLDASVISAMDTARRDRFRRDVLANDGATENVYTGAVPVTGFMVSVAKAELPVPFDGFVAHGCAVLREYERRNDGLLSRDGAFLGAWVCDGSVYLDVSYNVPELGAALAMAEVEGQLAIWDVENGREIRL